MVDLVTPINYGETLFVAKMKERAFVNQRLTRLTATDRKVDVALCHALLNCYLGLFYIEGLGFGRGLGTLDLNSTKMHKSLYLLNPEGISPQQRRNILNAFKPLLKRAIHKLPRERTMADRQAFEQTVAEAYGLTTVWNRIEEALVDLYTIRNNVKPT